MDKESAGKVHVALCSETVRRVVRFCAMKAEGGLPAEMGSYAKCAMCLNSQDPRSTLPSDILFTH